MGLTFDVIIASPKKRSQQTAAIVAEAVGFPLDGIEETEKVKAMTPVEETVRYLEQFKDTADLRFQDYHSVRKRGNWQDRCGCATHS
jgi:phosphohistidine phosphatase SixA